MTTFDKNNKVVKWSIWLAHHPKEQCNDKCFKLGLKTKVYVCSRCLGLYPTMFLLIFIDFYFKFQLSSYTRAWIFAFLVFPGWLHWASEALKNKICISKSTAFFSSLPAGIGTGILLTGHFRHPYNSAFLFILFLTVILSGSVVFLKNFFNN